MANPVQNNIIDRTHKEIKNICINPQENTDSSYLEIKSLSNLIINKWEEKE